MKNDVALGKVDRLSESNQSESNQSESNQSSKKHNTIVTQSLFRPIIFGYLVLAVFLFSNVLLPSKSLAEPPPQEILSRFSSAKPLSEEYNDDLVKTEWRNPAPSYKHLGLSDEELIDLVGDRIMVTLHEPITIDVPYYGEMVRWTDARFSTAFTEMPMSAKDARAKIIENDLTNGWSDYIPFVESAEVIHKSEKHIAMRYKVEAKVLFVKAKVEGVYKDILEDDGSISSTYLYGSAQIFTRRGNIPLMPKALLSPLPMSNVRRWEFIPITEKRSLVVLTDWAEVSNKSGLSKRMTMYSKEMQQKDISDEDLAGPYPFPAMGLYALKTVLLKQTKQVPESQTRVREKADVPNLSASINKAALEKLIRPFSPVVFVHPPQTVAVEYGNIPFNFVTAVNKVKGDVEGVRKFGSQAQRTDEYVKQLRFSKLDGGSIELPDFSDEQSDMEGPRVHLQIKFGKGIPGLTTFKINYWVKHFWENENRLNFVADGGDVAEIFGALDWVPANEENTSLLFATSTSDTGPDAKFPLSIMKLVPGADVFSGIMSNVLGVGRQTPWIEEQIALETKAVDAIPVGDMPVDAMPVDAKQLDKAQTLDLSRVD